MILPVVFRREARPEFENATMWYEEQRAGLGAEFVDEIDRVVSRVCRAPKRFALVYGDIRRVVVRRFPYLIFYRLETSRIVIVAVFHASRDPEIWQGRS